MQLSEVPLQIQVRKATEFLDGRIYENVQRYPMRSKPRGLVLIITNIHYKNSDEVPRSSAAHDKENLKQLFEQMGFSVIPYVDLTGQVYVAMKFCSVHSVKILIAIICILQGTVRESARIFSTQRFTDG